MYIMYTARNKSVTLNKPFVGTNMYDKSRFLIKARPLANQIIIYVYCAEDVNEIYFIHVKND